MAALEFRILTKLLKEGSLQEAIRKGLGEDQFKDPEARQIWRHLHRHWYNRPTFKSLPSIASVQRKWPSFQLTADSSDDEAEGGALKALIHDLKMSSFESDARSLASYFQDLVDEDPHEAMRAIQKHASDVIRQLKNSEQLGLSEVLDSAMEQYEGAKTGVIYGLPWPWDCLTQDTLGKRAGDFIVFYARMKQMKTWLMLFCAIHDYLENNARVIIWSREMNKTKMSLRAASLLAKVDYQLFKKGQLPPKLKDRAWKIFHALKEDDYWQRDEGTRSEEARLGKRQLLFLCGRDAPKTLEELRSIIQEFSPDVVYLDSFYHMDSRATMSTQRHIRIGELAEDVKELAEDENIPIIAVHQANRLGEKTHGNTMADMADSDIIAREADLIARVIKRRGRELYEEDYEVEAEREQQRELLKKKSRPRIGRIHHPLPRKVEEAAEKKAQELEEDTPRVGAELAIVLPGNREGVLDAFTIHAVPGYNFDFISSDYSVKEIQDWMDKDSDEDDKPNKAAAKKPDKPDYSAQKTFKNYKGKA